MKEETKAFALKAAYFGRTDQLIRFEPMLE